MTRVKKTKVEQMKDRLKNHPVIIILSAMVFITVYFAQFTNALQSLYSFFVKPEKTQTIPKVEPNIPSEAPPPIVRFPFNLQIRNAKERIRYLSREYLKTETMSLIEVKGVYGDNVLDSPQLYDWDKVMNELERQGYIKILQQTNDNIVFKILKQFSESQVITQEVKIISPKDGDEVPRTIVVRGNSSLKLSKGEYLWLIVNPIPSAGDWWPQGPINPHPQSGKWNVEASFGREKEDIGYEFDIAIVLVAEKDNQYYWDYIKRERVAKDFPATPFPNSATIIYKITVRRR
jgi:hypothetical protein